MRALAPAALVLLPILAGACSFGPPVQTDAPLEETRWEVVEVRGVQPPEGADPAPFLTVRSSTGDVVGNSGCNTFNGPYRATGNELVMGPLASTRRACAGRDLGNFETIMFDALSRTRFYVVRLNELFLYEGEDALVRLRRADR